MFSNERNKTKQNIILSIIIIIIKMMMIMIRKIITAENRIMITKFRRIYGIDKSHPKEGNHHHHETTTRKKTIST